MYIKYQDYDIYIRRYLYNNFFQMIWKNSLIMQITFYNNKSWDHALKFQFPSLQKHWFPSGLYLPTTLLICFCLRSLKCPIPPNLHTCVHMKHSCWCWWCFLKERIIWMLNCYQCEQSVAWHNWHTKDCTHHPSLTHQWVTHLFSSTPALWYTSI